MPHTLSAKKRLRQNEERRIRNKDRTTEIKSIRKRILRAVHDGHEAEAKTLYRQFTKRIDQAASLNTIHKNAADRSKSRIAKVIAGGPAAAAIVSGIRIEVKTKPKTTPAP
jgi:small subunit ribosomal protein S20